MVVLLACFETQIEQCYLVFGDGANNFLVYNISKDDAFWFFCCCPAFVLDRHLPVCLDCLSVCDRMTSSVLVGTISAAMGEWGQECFGGSFGTGGCA